MLSWVLLMLLMAGNLQAASSSSSAGAVGPETEETRIIDLPEAFVGFALADGGVGSVGGGFDTKTCVALVTSLSLRDPDKSTHTNMKRLKVMHEALRRTLLTDTLQLRTKKDIVETVEQAYDQIEDRVWCGLKDLDIAMGDITAIAQKCSVIGLLNFIDAAHNKRLELGLLERPSEPSNRLFYLGSGHLVDVCGISRISGYLNSRIDTLKVRRRAQRLVESGYLDCQEVANLLMGEYKRKDKQIKHYAMCVAFNADSLQEFAQAYVEQKEERERLQREQEEQEQRAKEKEAELEDRVEVTHVLSGAGRQAPGCFDCLFRMFD